MKIVLAVGSLDLGGTEQQVVGLACRLAERSHEVTVLVFAGGRLADALDGSGVELWDLDIRRRGWLPPTGWWRILTLPVALRRRRPDVVHAFLFAAYATVLPAAALARVPRRILGRRNMRTRRWGSRPHHLLDTIAESCAQQTIANAHAVAERLVADGTPARKVLVIHNGIDLPPRAAAVDRQPPVAVMIANLIEYKGHLDMVSALAALDDPPRVDCYGDGPARPAIERAVAEAGLGDRVRLVGVEPEAARRYGDAQLGLLASHEEGLPNAVLEAVAAGLPVVATDVGGVRELVRDGVNGYVVPPHDPASLATAIGRLAADPDGRARMGEASRQLAASAFSWESCVDAHLEAYAPGPEERRFSFGENWQRYLEHIDDTAIAAAEHSLREALGVHRLDGQRFLDVGCGSGLFSLAAWRLGASVRSFDYDPDSVAATVAVREQFADGDRARWDIGHGDVLDDAFVSTLGTWDVVYSWGVLHHTGAMWRAIDNAAALVAPGGRLFLAIYNDQGWQSRCWTSIKRFYTQAPLSRPVLLAASLAAIWGGKCAKALPQPPWVTWRRYREERGMSPWTDLVDWVGGYPFEVASARAVRGHLEARGHSQRWSRLVGSKLGCNEFVFERSGTDAG